MSLEAKRIGAKAKASIIRKEQVAIVVNQNNEPEEPAFAIRVATD
jgi:hypothetical protein